MTPNRPKFLASYFGALSKEVQNTSVLNIVPYWFLIFGAGGFYITFYHMPDHFWAGFNWDVSTAVFAGLLTFNGLILVLGWAAFSRIYDVLFSGPTASYLADKNLLNDYLLQITYMHMIQIIAVLFSGSGLVSILIESMPIWADKTIFSLSIIFTAYATKQALDSVTMMNDLVWQSAYYEKHIDDPRSETNVTKLGTKNGS